MIQLSIALVTRNRSESLAKTLHSLSLQNFAPYEVIISDDSNQPNEIEATKRLAEQYKCTYKTGPQKGLYANRNFAAKQCTGTHIRTMDDDHLFPDDHFAECLKAIEEEPGTIWTIGEYNVRNTKREKPYPVPGQLHPKGHAVAPDEVSEYYGISCGASIYPKKVIEDGILNTELYKFGIVYLEYGARLKYFGFTLKYLATTYIIHDDIATTANQLTKAVVSEARVFSMLSLSFYYQPSFANKTATLLQLVKMLITKQISIHDLRSAYNHFTQWKTKIENQKSARP